jgi:hypothetical protein
MNIITSFTPLEIMPRYSVAGLSPRIIPAGFNAPLEFLTGLTIFLRIEYKMLKLPNLFIGFYIDAKKLQLFNGRN